MGKPRREVELDIFTIGYEGANIEAFIYTLRRLNISHVIDIRDLPASRRRDFSKNILKSHLQEHSIEYSHFKPLGDPKPGREAMRRGDVSAFTEIFHAHMKLDAAQNALEEVMEIASNEPSVLLCFERDPKGCHRSIVATSMAQKKAFKIRHIGVQPLMSRSDRVNSRIEYQPSC